MAIRVPGRSAGTGLALGLIVLVLAAPLLPPGASAGQAQATTAWVPRAASPGPSTTYSLTYSESGLPAGTSWGVTVNGRLNFSFAPGSIGFSLPDGSYSYQIADVPGYHQTTLRYAGNVTIDGAPVNEPTLAFSRVTYPIDLSQSGLPTSTTWAVTVNGTTHSAPATSDILFDEPNGTYAYAIADIAGYHQVTLPYSGAFNVTGTELYEPTLIFVQQSYAVTWQETGLPSGVAWGVTLNGQLYSSASPRPIVVDLPNGTYAYGLSDVPGFHQTSVPYSGSLTVGGRPVAPPTVAFYAITYNVTFNSVGLPAGTVWTLVIDGAATPSSTSGYVNLTLGNGSYEFGVRPVAGYAISSSGAYLEPLRIEGAGVEVAIDFLPAGYELTFNAIGLNGSGNWSVATGGELAGAPFAQSLVFWQPNGTVDYQVQPVPGYTTRWLGNASIAGSDRSVSIAFTSVLYNLSVVASGLPAGTSWSVRVAGSLLHPVGNLASIALSNGTYAYLVAEVPGWQLHGVPYAGAVTVSAGPVTLNLPFVLTNYTLTFTESGLAPSTRWTVDLNGSARSSSAPSAIVFEAPNGTYAWTVAALAGYRANLSSGSAQLLGADRTLDLGFTVVGYPATFEEAGLPSGTSWSVTAGGVSNRSATSEIVVTVPNGTIPYSIANVPGWRITAGAYSGTLTVHAAPPPTVSVGFSQSTYAISFSEIGLPSGGRWSVTLNGSTESSSGGAIGFDLANGSYSYTVGPPAGYLATPANGTIALDGAPQAVAVSLSATPNTTGGLSAYLVWGAAGAGVAVVVIAGVLTLARRARRRGRGPADLSGPIPPSAGSS